jgi:putative transposase
MRTRYKISDKETVYFITSTIVDWKEVFKSDNYFDILINSLNFKRKDSELKLFAYVFMRNHIHLILCCNDIIKFVKELKSFTARQIIKQLEIDNEKELLNHFIQNKKIYKTDSKYQIWQEGFHPELICNLNTFRQKAEYIHNNPVRKGYVLKPELWKYSSATNYLLGSGVIDIDSPI